jgi:hypothetical protein
LKRGEKCADKKEEDMFLTLFFPTIPLPKEATTPAVYITGEQTWILLFVFVTILMVLLLRWGARR